VVFCAFLWLKRTVFTRLLKNANNHSSLILNHLYGLHSFAFYILIFDFFNFPSAHRYFIPTAFSYADFALLSACPNMNFTKQQCRRKTADRTNPDLALRFTKIYRCGFTGNGYNAAMNCLKQDCV
jgi:hypothetical protein